MKRVTLSGLLEGGDPIAVEEVEHALLVARVEQALFGSRGTPLRLGRYQVLEKVGRGGGGTVYRGRDPDLGGFCTQQVCDEPDDVGEPCGPSICEAGQVCCNESCGICTEPGDFCTQQVCDEPGDVGVECGPTVCAAGEVCCNESCGICTQPGDACTQQVCSDPEPVPDQCGDGVCPEGLVCCNASCGICTEPGGACIQIVCE